MDKALHQAIAILELLQHPDSQTIIGYLQEVEKAAYVDLLVQVPEAGEDLRDLLDKMLAANLLVQETVYYQDYYLLNLEKLERVSAATRKHRRLFKPVLFIG